MRWRWPRAALAVNKPAVLFFTMAGIRALEGPAAAARRLAPRRHQPRARRRRLRDLAGSLRRAWRALHRMRNGPALARHRPCRPAHRRSLHGRGHRDLAGRNQAGHAPGHAIEDQSGDFMTSAAYDVLGIGNAIVDVLSRADDAFLEQARPGQGQHDADRRGSAPRRSMPPWGRASKSRAARAATPWRASPRSAARAPTSARCATTSSARCSATT